MEHDDLIFKSLEILHSLTKPERDFLLLLLAKPTHSIPPEADRRLIHPAKVNPFLKKLFKILRVRFSDPFFGIKDLSTEFSMSRMTIFRKVKSHTGYATSDLIRNYRLTRARELLKKEHSVSDTARKAGFKSQAYFSKCFRDRYKITPSGFIQQYKK
ncbi:helix-turn-helix domain-containing protein [Dyadobacter aurulentus]|uniref:helix-turn-helix domain-containing protein n=1 Tax=Dyadobacter sp. UC 10 TaxID=2605428 RepID=UPI0011F32D58|nr:helix-turn-helix transcriptional regulator [Dyadobacter sp. UC 10]KAA0993377.1 helix-turn-helix transcriptional regulator [Dyadobacter sp. UC 10]